MMSFLKKLIGGGGARRLDDALVARIADTLRIEPSEQLREILAGGVDRGGIWSPEAVEAAQRILEKRANNLALEPVYRTVPRSQQEQAARVLEELPAGLQRRLLMLDVGSQIYCGWRNQSGTIIRWHDEDERFYIRYVDGQGEWATLGMFE
jgi:hypothetical protein